MLPELGYFALILALIVAVVQAVFPLLGALNGNVAWMRQARSAAYLLFFLILLAFACLAVAFITNDFSVLYVAANSNRHLPFMYRVGALWGAHEGSMLLWVLILSVWSAAVAKCSQQLPLPTVSRVLGVLAIIAVGFLLFILLTSNPFVRLLSSVPADGRDLNPLLQDPGLVGHPPMLYMGYVGFAVAFAFAIAGLMEGDFQVTWAYWTRPWTLIAWCFLTLGITLGSWWSYRVLGWGGWWAWDPVENASFLPWLAGTALIHSLMVAEKRNAFKGWTVLLAICAFSLSLVGTFLVRSGVLVSVHAFAVDPKRGRFILAFLAVVIGGSLSLYAWRATQITQRVAFRFCSRETFLLANNVILLATMLTVLLGTLYPLMIDALGLGKLSVGAPYFNLVFIPLMIPLLVLMGIGPATHWHHSEPDHLYRRLRFSLVFAVLVAATVGYLNLEQWHVMTLLGFLLALWVLVATLQTGFGRREGLRPRFLKMNRSRVAMLFAHVGLAVCVLGIVLSQASSVSRDVRMGAHDIAKVGPYQFQLLGVRDITGPNYRGVEAGMLVRHNQQIEALLKPQLRQFNASKTTVGKTAIEAGLFKDLYVAMGQPLSDNTWSFRLYYKPFIRWIWLGGLLMVLGSLLAATDKRYRADKLKVKTAQVGR